MAATGPLLLNANIALNGLINDILLIMLFAVLQGVDSVHGCYGATAALFNAINWCVRYSLL